MLKNNVFKIGSFDAALLHLDTFGLDGGAMFGIVPKALWNRVYECDEENRILLHGSSLLIMAPGVNILVETGMGTKLSEREKIRFNVVNEQTFTEALHPFSLTPKDIDIVILTHLHFDHAGGATELRDGIVHPTFPKARYIVQKADYEAASNPNERTRGSYHQDDFLPLMESGNLVLVDGEYEVAPGVTVIKTGGHTAGHQAVRFESNGEQAVHLGDLVPTTSHIPLPYIMGYDTYPLASLEVRKKLYREIVEKDMKVIFPHDIHHTVAEAGAFDL
jgi:glyoxylase-like metal-dependent hydrolase (beta-lactamase superfamily II)